MSLSCDYNNFGSPFDDSDVDLILRSKPSEPTGENDRGVATQFRVHKLFLTKASPFFKKVLSEIHHPSIDNQLEITRDKYADLPVLCLPEDHDTLHSLLTFIYPINVARPRTLESIVKTCAAAKKCLTEVGDLRDWLSSSRTGNNHSSCQPFDKRPRGQFVLFTQDVTKNFPNMSLPRFVETLTSKGEFNCPSCGDYLQFDFLRLFSNLERRVNDRIGEASPAFLSESQIDTPD